jgi:hypothetical protein
MRDSGCELPRTILLPRRRVNEHRYFTRLTSCAMFDHAMGNARALRSVYMVGERKTHDEPEP